jgi:hypothetical protein
MYDRVVQWSGVVLVLAGFGHMAANANQGAIVAGAGAVVLGASAVSDLFSAGRVPPSDGGWTHGRDRAVTTSSELSALRGGGIIVVGLVLLALGLGGLL